jgi:hypothetical protein
MRPLPSLAASVIADVLAPEEGAAAVRLARRPLLGLLLVRALRGVRRHNDIGLLRCDAERIQALRLRVIPPIAHAQKPRHPHLPLPIAVPRHILIWLPLPERRTRRRKMVPRANHHGELRNRRTTTTAESSGQRHCATTLDICRPIVRQQQVGAVAALQRLRVLRGVVREVCRFASLCLRVSLDICVETAAERDDAHALGGVEDGLLAEEEEVLADLAGGGDFIADAGRQRVTPEAEVGGQGDLDLAAEELLDVFGVAGDIGGARGGEEVAEEEGEGEFVFCV